MPCWYFEKKELRNTPSAQDGIDFETESRYRREGARFIKAAGTKMDLGYNTMATGVVYFHRFYMYHSFRNFPRYVTACCCLFLAGKVEETPKKCRDIIDTVRSLLTDEKFATFGDDPKEEVMILERILLQTIKFDLQVEHPYSFLLKYAKCLKGDKAKLHKMLQMAWTFVNDSLCTTLSLQWEPEVIAVAMMYLAGKLSKFEVVDWVGRTSKHLRWWDMFIEDVTMDLLEDICHQVLDVYSQPQKSSPPDSPPLTPRGPPNKKDQLPPNQTPAPNTAVPPPTKIPKTDIKMLPANGEKIAVNENPNNVPDPNIGSSVIPTTYQYNTPAYSAGQPGYQPPFSANVPPANYAAPPPNYPPNYHAPPPPPPTNNHGQYYPPPGMAANVGRPPYYPPAGPPP
ncbi:cyclin-K-like [Lycorma delicatula]|uniref:cyclin-K-like n=1 Tax=Lycorma delicatula TaxID=130591 RepID=UPI003F515643